MGFVQDMEEVPLRDPVAFQLLQHVMATVPPAVTPCHRHFVLSWELQRCHQPPCADTSLKVVSLQHPQCKQDRIVHVPSVCHHCPSTRMESFVSLHHTC